MKLSTIVGSLAAVRAVLAAPANDVSRRTDYHVPANNDPRFQGVVLDAHYYWRTIHCAQQLHWDDNLAKAAQESVNGCTQNLQHDRGGSNLSGVGRIPTEYDDWIEEARRFVHGWHEEEHLYPYDNPSYEARWGHFTQMVWRDSSRVGCAMQACENKLYPGRLYCFYENAGNNIAEGEFARQVWRPTCADPAPGFVPQ